MAIDKGVEAVRQLPDVLRRIEAAAPNAGVNVNLPAGLPDRIGQYGDTLASLKTKSGAEATAARAEGNELAQQSSAYVGTMWSTAGNGRFDAMSRIADAQKKLAAVSKAPQLPTSKATDVVRKQLGTPKAPEPSRMADSAIDAATIGRPDALSGMLIECCSPSGGTVHR